jgi:hypothetical protein
MRVKDTVAVLNGWPHQYTVARFGRPGPVGIYKHGCWRWTPRGRAGHRRAPPGGPRRLAGQVEHLSKRSDSFSLPAFRKWARLLTDPGNAKGWPTVFADRVSLFDACLSVHENLVPSARWGGGNLRGL